jgi:hypothetical protein
MTDIIDINTKRGKRQQARETPEQALRRALAGRAIRCLPAKHEAALFIWRAAAVADSDPRKAADFLEMAAQRLWKGGD